MQFLGIQVLFKRIKAIKFMMKDKSVPRRKKALIILGIVYIFLPIDLIPIVSFSHSVGRRSAPLAVYTLVSSKRAG